MHGQVEGRSVSAAGDFDPSVGGEGFGVPAVTSVVGHLVGHVLPEGKHGLAT